MTHEQQSVPVNRRQHNFFVISVAMVGLAEMFLCLSPIIAYAASHSSLFSDSLQEGFFFDILGWIGGFWLLSWVSAICSWKGVAQLGQWFGIVLLSLDQAALWGVWNAFSHYHNF